MKEEEQNVKPTISEESEFYAKLGRSYETVFIAGAIYVIEQLEKEFITETASDSSEIYLWELKDFIKKIRR